VEFCKRLGDKGRGIPRADISARYERRPRWLREQQQQAVGLGQLTLDAGGATVDTSRIGSVKWGAETRDLEGQFRKGDDIAIALVARVVEVKLRDVYDAHGNVKETIREHVIRVDEQSANVATGRGLYRGGRRP
jgi:hypothetical protein